eukprot:symbB.v1.2.008385.t1/scaffold525.1/size192214/10
MHLFCKCGKKDKEVADQIQKLQDGIDGLQDDVSSLTKRLEATIEAQSKVLHLEFIEDTTEALVALTGRIEHLELLKEGNNLHSQEMKSFGREVRNLASRLDRSEERQMSFKSELEKSHEASFQEMRSDLLSCQENLKTLQASFDQGKKESDIFVQAQVQQQEKNHRESHEKTIVRIDEQRQEFQLAQQRVHIELEQFRAYISAKYIYAFLESCVDEFAMGGDDDVQCALVEYVRGIRARKWSFQLGQTYIVGRSGGCVDIEIEHNSLSRKHCSLAITHVDDDLILVAMDHGSTNGTFINKSRLEKGVGLKMKVADVKHMVFGECENGYKFLVKEPEESPLEKPKQAKGQGSGASAGPSQCELHVDAWARGAPAAEEGDAPKKKRGPGGPGGSGPGPNSGAGANKEKAGPNRRERRAAARGEGGRPDASKSSWRSAAPEALAERVSKKARGSKNQDPLDIEWPEEWK